MEHENSTRNPKQFAIAVETRAKRQTTIFCNVSVSRTQVSWSIKNQPETPKQCDIAHETGPKRQNNEFLRRLDRRAQGSWIIKIDSGPQNSALWPTEMSLTTKTMSFCDVSIAVHTVMEHLKSTRDPKTVCYSRRNSPETRKQSVITHQSGLKRQKHRVFATSR